MNTHQSKKKSLNLPGKAKSLVGALTLGLAVTFISSCGEATQNGQVTGEGNVTSEDVTQVDPGDAAIGEEVTIRSGVSEVLDDNGFVMESSDGEPVLIINPTGTPFTSPEQEVPIQVTGELTTFDAAAIEQQYGLTLDPNLYGEYDQQPAVIAQNFALAPRPQDLWDAPTGYFEETVAVEGDIRPLEETNNAFALFEEGWVDDIGVLVIGTDQYVDANALEDGENVVVTGQTQQISADILRQANLGWEDAEIEEFISRYENRPVIIAEEVYPSAEAPHPTL